MGKQSLIAFAAALAACLTWPANGAYVERACLGNLETFDRKVMQAGVQYKLSYVISGATAKIRFAGREFDASVDRGGTWKGPWLKRMDDTLYFSSLPEEGGTIKFQFDPNRWYSGNC